MQSAIQTHVYVIYFFLAVMLFNLYSVSTQKDFIKLAKRLRFMTPLYHLTNAIVIYTGTIVAFYAQYFSLTIALMIPASIFLLVIEIKRYKKMRVIKSGDIQLQEEFYKYAKKIYIIEIMVLVFVYMISKVF
ncbi:putative membrane protein [Malaciobacter pacificus]|uniref:Putative membrane protein n=2 Tax=Malaciobacter pacificus TaxID=1080223 RepID=A0A5C2H3E2_9BACT|nr:putative membrane protein [Malaciobacter pacificus]